MICDPNIVFDNFNVLKKTSASQSIQLLAQINPKAAYKVLQNYMRRRHTRDIFVKIGFFINGDNSADVEQAIYKYLYKLYLTRRTPNIMRYVANFECDELKDYLHDQINRHTLSKTLKSKYDRLINMIDNLEDQNDKLNGNIAKFLLIERGNGYSLDYLLTNMSITSEEFLEIMFQVFYTLREMYIHRVRHNDIHLGNIWINVHKKPQHLIYFVDDKHYSILNTRYIAKIYDFDRATFTAGPLKNKIIEDYFCPDYGMCSNDDPYYDPHTIAYLLFHRYGNISFARKFAFAVINNPKWLDETCCEIPGRYCDKTMIDPITNEMICSKNFVPKPGGINTFTNLYFDTNVFNKYKYNLDTDGYDLRDLPAYRILDKDEIPLYAFENFVFISTVCKRLPIEMANMLYKRFGH
jgi:hypothetical protein